MAREAVERELASGPDIDIDALVGDRVADADERLFHLLGVVG